MVFGMILSLVSLLCHILWFLSHFSIFLIHYFFVLLILLCVVSKFMRLKGVTHESISKIFSPESYPISYLGSLFDVPENSKASFEYVRMHFDRLLYWFYPAHSFTFRAARTRALEYSSASTWRPTISWCCLTNRLLRRQTFTSISARQTLTR